MLLRTYRAAGGARHVVLFHDEKHGSPLIAAMARLGEGLPPNVLPLSLFSVLQLGHEALASALAFGAEQIVVLAPPEHPAELAALEGQIGLTAAILNGLGYQGPRMHLSTDRDPETIEALLYTLPALPTTKPETFMAIGTRRHRRIRIGQAQGFRPEPKDLIALPRLALAASASTCRAARCVSPASAPARPMRCPTIPSGRSSPSRRAPAQCGVCVAPPARRR
jgi:hypothetical protein